MCRISRLALALFALSLALPSLSAQLSSSPATPATSSTPTSLAPDGLWQLLLDKTQSLPTEYDSFISSLTGQITSFRLTNQSLKASNASLTSNNALLTASLQASQAKAATSEAKSKELQTSLDASTLSITRAQADAKVLEFQLGIWRSVAITAGITVCAAAIYEGGRALKFWR